MKHHKSNAALQMGMVARATAIGVIAMGLLGASSDAEACEPDDAVGEWRGVDILFQWNQVTLDFYPPEAHFITHTRELALVHVAIHDAINSIHPHYETYGEPIPVHHNASPEAAATAAAHFITVKLHPNLKDYLDDVYQESLDALPHNKPTKRGIKIGEAAAKQLWNLRKNDGWDAPTPPYQFPPPGPGVWRPVPPASPTTPPPFPQWRYVDPWAMSSAQQFLAPPPPALTSATFQNDFYETKSIGAAGSVTRTQDQSEAALWWASQPSQLVANYLARELMVDFDVGFYDSARILALANIATADVIIANINSKETYQFWRPYTAITVNYGIPGLVTDPSWAPFLTTPGNQEYPAGHPEGGGALRGVLEHFFGDDPLPWPVGYTSPNGVSRSFTSIPEIEADVINARVAGGMHFRNSGNVGAALGRGIAAWTIDHVLRPICD